MKIRHHDAIECAVCTGRLIDCWNDVLAFAIDLHHHPLRRTMDEMIWNDHFVAVVIVSDHFEGPFL